MIAHVNASGLALMHRSTEWPEPKLSIIAKGVVDLDGKLLAQDVAFDADDLVPVKARTDVLVSGGADESGKHRLTLGATRVACEGMSGFAPIAATDPARMKKLGTFDQRWVDERWPWYPADFDASYFNAAPDALQLETPRGDEALTFEHALTGKTVARLPALRVRAFLHSAETFVEVPLVLDTIALDLDRGCLAVTWRGFVAETAVDHIYLVSEPLADEPLSVAHHEQQLTLALLVDERAPERPQERANDNEPEIDDAEDVSELAAMMKQAGAPANVLEAIAGAKTSKEALAALSDLVNPDPKKAQAIAAAAMEKVRADLVAAGQDPSLFDVADEIDEIETLWTRGRVVACAKAGESMAGADLRGLDLSELDLTGVDFSEALMNEVCLRGATLYGANLSGVTMPDAELTDAVLGHAMLVDADLTRASAAQIDLRHANLEGVLLDGAVMPHARIDDAHGKGASFRKADLTGATFRTCELSDARFDDAILHGACFAEAVLVDASFEGARGDDVSFTQANLLRLRAGNDAAFYRADLTEAKADESIWFGADLREAKLTLSELRRADLSRAKLDTAKLDGANCANADFTQSSLHQASMLGANFAGACFTSADLSRADARKANFYEAELWRTNTKGTRLDEAHLAMTKLAPQEARP